jgi:hypothetical protein
VSLLVGISHFSSTDIAPRDGATEPSPFLLLTCQLFDGDGQTPRELVRQKKDSSNVLFALVGATTVRCTCLRDENGKWRNLFVFPELSVRVPGTYKLRFQLVDLASK